MNDCDLRYNLTPEQYLEKNQVMVYLEDAIDQLLEHKDDTGKVNASKFFATYFASVRDGTHVLLREFSFVKATPHNRASFVHLFWKSFANIARKTELMDVAEYHSLLCLLCSDFPLSIVQQSARIVLVDDSLDCLISFTDFVYALQLRLYYDEFLSKCGSEYKTLVQSRSVVVPTSEQRPVASSVAHGGSSGTGKNTSSSDGVDSAQYLRAVLSLCDRITCSVPVELVKNVLSASSRTSFYGFLSALAKSAALNEHIGKLPPRLELLTTYEPEMTSLCVKSYKDLLLDPAAPISLRTDADLALLTELMEEVSTDRSRPVSAAIAAHKTRSSPARPSSSKPTSITRRSSPRHRPSRTVKHRVSSSDDDDDDISSIP